MYVKSSIPGESRVPVGYWLERQHQIYIHEKNGRAINSPRQVNGLNSRCCHNQDSEGPEGTTSGAGTSTRTTWSKERIERNDPLDIDKSDEDFSGSEIPVSGSWKGGPEWINTWNQSSAAKEEPADAMLSGSGSTSRGTSSSIQPIGDSSGPTNYLLQSLDPKVITSMVQKWWNLSLSAQLKCP